MGDGLVWLQPLYSQGLLEFSLFYNEIGDITSLIPVGKGVKLLAKFADKIESTAGKALLKSGLGKKVRGRVVSDKDLNPVSERGVAFFGKDNLRYYAANPDGSAPNLGAPGRGFFFMPIDDAAKINSPVRAATETGFAHSVRNAWLNGEDVYGVSFPLDGLTPRAPTKVDADGWRHFLEGGNTAINAKGTDSFIVNQTREFVIDGGVKMPEGTQLFRLGDNGEWIPLWGY